MDVFPSKIFKGKPYSTKNTPLKVRNGCLFQQGPVTLTRVFLGTGDEVPLIDVHKAPFCQNLSDRRRRRLRRRRRWGKEFFRSIMLMLSVHQKTIMLMCFTLRP